MQVKMFVCAAVLLAFIVAGSNAQLDVCGNATFNTYYQGSWITGRRNASPGSWPWQASLQYNGRHICGGSLINNQWVMTAAHCVVNGSIQGNLVVYLGLQTQQGNNSNAVSRSVSQIFIHPNYSSWSRDNDIALLNLSSPVSFTDYIQPVCLAAPSSVFAAGTNCWITGWGNNQTGAPFPSPQTLQEASVSIVSNNMCNYYYGGITSNMMCASLSQGGTDSCQGDSGGPMVWKNYNNRWVQAGIVSSGQGCAQSNFPAVYTSVSQYQGWIDSKITFNQPGFFYVYTTNINSFTSSSTVGSYGSGGYGSGGHGSGGYGSGGYGSGGYGSGGYGSGGHRDDSIFAVSSFETVHMSFSVTLLLSVLQLLFSFFVLA